MYMNIKTFTVGCEGDVGQIADRRREEHARQIARLTPRVYPRPCRFGVQALRFGVNDSWVSGGEEHAR